MRIHNLVKQGTSFVGMLFPGQKKNDDEENKSNVMIAAAMVALLLFS